MTAEQADLVPQRQGSRLQTTSTWRVVLASAGLLVVIIPLIAFGLGSAISSLTANTLETAMRRSAATMARDWADYFATHFSGFERVLDTGVLTTEQRKFIAAARQVGQVYRFKLYDSRARLVLVSDEPQNAMLDPSRRSHDVQAVKVIQTGKGVVTLDAGEDKPGDPVFPAAAYVPVNSTAGEPIGVVAVYIDQSAAHTAFLQGFDGLSLKLSAIAVGVFLIPAFGFAWRNVQVARRSLYAAGAVAAADAEIGRLTADRERLGLRLSALETQLEARAYGPIVLRKGERNPDADRNFERLAFDDWLVQQIEEQAQDLPPGIDVECQLGLGDTLATLDAAAMRSVLGGLLRHVGPPPVEEVDDAQRTIVIATRQTERGIDLTLTGQSHATEAGLTAARAIMARLGGGIDAAPGPGQCVTVTAWWPHHHLEQKAA